ncbi:hypothetical protein STRDD11_00525 [Streptococcus sp. DD11]|nr:hypothetical protein STRDD11_00525 [Streptococcus sp. DD11]
MYELRIIVFLSEADIRFSRLSAFLLFFANSKNKGRIG